MSYCKNHRRYQGKRKPRSACEACWYVYFACNVWQTRVYQYEIDNGHAPEGAYRADEEG